MDIPSGDATVLAGSDDLTGKTIGRFHITALLGKGGMGEVYLAEDSLLKRPVALKRVSASLRSNPEYRAMLIKEAARASRLNDEHVARVHDIVDHEGEMLLVMEYVEGRSLRDVMVTPLSFEQRLDIAKQCVEALVAAHQSGIVHRDIKPENIMVTKKGRVKICDFGLAQQGTWLPDSTLLGATPTTGFRGTPAYMAPEALLNRNPDFRADMFSLGIVLYELFGGVHPFRDGENHMSTAVRIIHGEAASLSQVNASLPPPVAKIIAKMLQKDPARRYDDPGALLAQLVEIKPAPIQKSTKRTSALIFFLCLVAVMVVVFARLRLKPDLKPVITAPRTLVVLPFRSVAGNTAGQTYADGLTETVTAQITRLAGLSGIQVPPSSEVRAKNVVNAEDAKRQFSANLVLAGTLVRSDSSIVFTFSMFDAATLRQLKADTIRTSNSSTFTLEDEIANEVSAALNVPSAADHTSDTTVAAAHDSFIEGKGYLNDSGKGDHLQTAIRSFEQATKLDPGYAKAFASLGEAYWNKYESTNEPVWLELARQQCLKADMLDARSAEAKVCLGTVDFGGGEYEMSISDFDTALKIDSANDSAYLGIARAYERLGKYDDAERTLRTAVHLKPNYYLVYARLGQFYLRRTKYSDAVDAFQREISLVPNGEYAYLDVSAAYIYLGRYDDAITVLRRSIEIRPTAKALSNLGSTYIRLRRFNDAIPTFEQATKVFPRSYIFMGNLARAYYWAGRRADASAAFQRAIELASDQLRIDAREPDAQIMISRYYAMLGQRSEALNHLSTALNLRSTEAEYFSIAAVIHNQFGDRSSTVASLKKAIALGWSVAEIQSEPEFDNLRQDPEFQKLFQH